MMSISNALRVRWIEICLPIFLGVFLLTSFAFIIYSGPAEEKLANRAERFLIAKTLEATTWQAPKNSPISVVTLELDSGNIDRFAKTKTSNAALKIGEVLQRVFEDGPSYVFLLPPPHVLASEVDRSYLATFSNTAQFKNKLAVVYTPEQRWALDGFAEGQFEMLVKDDCTPLPRVTCLYKRSVAKSSFDSLIEFYWGNSAENAPRYHISKNLPSFGRQILLNLPLEKSMNQLSGSHILSGKKLDLSGQVVFIGFKFQPSDVHLDNQVKSHLSGHHLVLGQIASMLHFKRTLGVPPEWVTSFLLVCLCSIIFILLWKVGTNAALMIFVVYSIFYPFLNALGVRLFAVYVPMFDFFFGGFLTFIIAFYGQLSLRAFKKARSRAMEQSLSNVAELRQNFISMVSHDLNTPLAKMIGLMDIIWAYQDCNVHRESLRGVRRDIAKLHLCLRAVLMSARLDAGSTNETSLSLTSLLEEFQDRITPLLEKLEIQYELYVIEKDSDLARTPF